VIKSVPVVTISFGYSYIYDVNATDVDVGDILIYSLDAKPLNMTIDPATGIVQWTPTKQQGGPHHVVVNVSDGHSFVLQAFDITVTVLTVYPPVVTLLSPPNGGNISTTTTALSWSWEDPDSDNISFDVYLSKTRSDVAAQKSTVRVGSSISETSFSTLELEKGSTYYWTVIPNDGENTGNCKGGIWSFNVVQTAVQNKVPVITSSPASTATVGQQYQYDVKARDDDISDVLIFSLSNSPDGMVINAQTGIITWTPTDAQVGNQTVTIEVSDGKVSTSQSFKITVKMVLPPPVNHKPVIMTIPDRTIMVDEDYVYQVAATDVDPGDVLSYKLEGQPDRMVILSNGLLAWTPSKDQSGKHTVTINVSDGKDSTAVQFNITVENKKTPRTDNVLNTIMLGIIVAIVVAIIVILFVVAAVRGRRRTDPEVEKEEKIEEEPKVAIKKLKVEKEKKMDEKEPDKIKVDEPVKTEVEPKISAKLKDEINLNDLEDKD
jgi:hypothetical protein